MTVFTKEDRIHLQAMMMVAQLKLEGLSDFQYADQVRKVYPRAIISTRELDKLRAKKP